MVKGGKKIKAKMVKHMNDNNGDSDIIFEFFKNLTDNTLKKKEKQLPFNLYFGAERRRKILDAIMLDPVNPDNKNQKKNGERILENYRGSLNEMVKREKKEIEMMKEEGRDYADDVLQMKRFMEKRIAEIERAKQPDPRDLEDLISDLNWRQKVEVLDAKSKRDLKSLFNMK